MLVDAKAKRMSLGYGFRNEILNVINGGMKMSEFIEIHFLQVRLYDYI